MLIRVRGHNDGIKAYLERGQKQDRDFERDEMDERVILAGDLDLTNEIIQSIDTSAERYLTVTLSFKEDEVSRTTLDAITRDFEAFAFSAYRSDEYCLYAEAHVPKLKSYVDRKSGEPVERKVHIHFVIPAVNLRSGRRLEPFGKVDQQTRFLEAFQEHTNAKYGLASPRDNRRVVFTDASEMISRYKGDVFAGANRELKAAIFEAMIARGVTRYEDFQSLVAEYGARRTRNAGRDAEYENVKPEDASKGINLKEYVFSREFVELGAEAKRAVLESRMQAEYVEVGGPRPTSKAFLDALNEWHALRAREVKYLNSGGAFYKIYRAAGTEEQRRLLAEREARFYQRYQPPGGLDGKEINSGDRSGVDGWRAWRRLDQPTAIRRRRELSRSEGGRAQTGWEGGERERDPSLAENERRGRRAGEDHDFDADDDRSRPTAESVDRVRSVSGRGVDGDTARREVLLPPDALLELGNQQAERTDPLRWPGDRERAGLNQPSEQVRDIESVPRWLAMAERMYAAYQVADPAERARLGATGASKFSHKRFGFNRALGGGKAPRDFEEEKPPRSFDQIQSFDSISSMPFKVNATNGQANVIGFNACARASTGREADTVRDQFARDLQEVRSSRAEVERDEIDEIKATLDAGRLLAALAHSHGLLVEKYQIGKGRDGGDRILCGSRNLNVSDFLTKEMNLPWADAAKLMREAYRAQAGLKPGHASRQTPERDLWQEFQRYLALYRQALRSEWAEQGRRELARRASIKSGFYARRSAIIDNRTLSAAARKAALSVARIERVEAEAVLRHQLARERKVLKEAARRSLTDQYREFLRERAQTGDAQALRELRRMRRLQPHATGESNHDPIFRAGTPIEANEIIYRGPVITHVVQANGNVDYKRNGVALLVDEGRSVRMWDQDREAIEIGLCLAQQKFGPTLTLSGPEVFQAAAARVAAEARVHVEFADPALERIRRDRWAELDAADADERVEARERDHEARQQARDMLRAPDGPQGEGSERNSERSGHDPLPPDGPEPSPDIDR